MYKYRDEGGTMHYVNSYQKVPPKYRDQIPRSKVPDYQQRKRENLRRQKERERRRRHRVPATRKPPDRGSEAKDDSGRDAGEAGEADRPRAAERIRRRREAQRARKCLKDIRLIKADIKRVMKKYRAWAADERREREESNRRRGRYSSGISWQDSPYSRKIRSLRTRLRNLQSRCGD